MGAYTWQCFIYDFGPINTQFLVVFEIQGCEQVSKHKIRLNFKDESTSSRPGPSKNKSKRRIIPGQQKITDDRFRHTRKLTQGRPVVHLDFSSGKVGQRKTKSTSSSSSSSKSSTTDYVSETSSGSGFRATDGTIRKNLYKDDTDSSHAVSFNEESFIRESTHLDKKSPAGPSTSG